MPATKLSYRSLRALQVCTVFTLTIMVQELWHFPRAGWTGFAVMMIYAGFDSGTTISRAYHRFWGMLLGLFSGYLLWFIGHLDYRTLILIIPVTVFSAYFLAAHAYSVPTVFTVNTAVIGTGFFAAHSNFSITFFLIDYAICTVIALAIVLLLEYFWFRHYPMMERFIYDAQQDLISHLHVLLALLAQPKLQRSKWLTACIAFNRSLAEMNNLLTNSQFVTSSKQIVGDEFKQFIAVTNITFMELKALYFARLSASHFGDDYVKLSLQVETKLKQLKRSC